MSGRRSSFSFRVAFAAAMSLVAGQNVGAQPVPDWVQGAPGLYRVTAGVRAKVNWQDHEAALEALLEHCCAKFRPPFDLPPGTTIVPGEDDKDLTAERTRQPDGYTIVTPPRGQEGKDVVPGAQPSRCAIDIGSRISTDGGATTATLGSASVSPVCTGGYVRVGPNKQVQQRIMCEHNGLQLVLEFTYGHVVPRGGLGQTWIETPRGKIGDLEGNDDWKSPDPRFPKKGNHVHLEVEGIYDKTLDSEMAHNLQLDGKPVADGLAELLRLRAAFMNDCLLKQCSRGR